MWGTPKYDEKIPSAWKKITSANQLEEILMLSEREPVAIFKHSTTCSRSAYAKERLIEAYNAASIQIKVHYLDLLSYRNLSNQVASDLKLVHQSPQFILIKDKRVIYSASHEAISYSKAVTKL